MWQKLAYADATQSGFLERFLASIDWTSLELSEGQVLKLRWKLGETVRYLQNPTFEQYYRLKTEGLDFRFRLSRDAAFWLTNNAVPGTANNSTAAQRDVVRAVWDHVHARSGRTNPPRVTSVCLDRVAAAATRTNTPWSLLSGKVGKGFTRAAEAINPGFEYPSATGNSPASLPGPIFVQLSFFATLEDSSKAGPIYLSFAWLPQDQNWAPIHLLADQWLGLSTLF